MSQKIISGDWSFAFSPASEAMISDIIKSLSERFQDGSIFLPHLTFYALTTLPDTVVQEIVSEIVTTTKSFSVELSVIGFEEKNSKTLFINVMPHPELKRIYELMDNKLHLSFVFKPHVSLIYKHDLPFNTRETLSKEIIIPQKLEVDSIILTSADDGKCTAEFYRDWKIDRYYFEGK